VNIRQRSAVFLAGVLAASVSIAASSLIVGPLLRRFIGTPPDFGADYTSGPAFGQALLSHMLCLSAAFVLIGMIVGARQMGPSSRAILWSANPVAILVGFIVARVVLPSEIPTEYSGNVMGAVVTGFGSFLCILSGMLGARLRAFTGARASTQ
jgi:hypothetical protein